MTRGRARGVGIALGLIVSLGLPGIAAASAPKVRIAIDERLDDAPAVEPSLIHGVPTFPLAVRLRVAIGTQTGTPQVAQLDALADRVRRYSKLGIEVWIAIEGPRPPADQLGTWSGVVKSVAERAGAGVALFELSSGGQEFSPAGGVLPSAVTAAAERDVFALKRAALDLRALVPEAAIVIGGTWSANPEALTRLYARDLAPYVDGVVVPVPLAPLEARGPDADEIAAVVEREDPGAFVIETGVRVTVPEAILDHALWRVGGTVRASSYAMESTADLTQALRSLEHVSDLLSTAIVRLDPARVALALQSSPAHVEVRHLVLYDTERFTTLLLYAATSTAADGLDVSIALAGKASPVIRDPKKGGTVPPTAAAAAGPARLRVSVPLRATPLILAFNDGLDTAVSERTGVAGRSTFTLPEIIARHQQARVVQDRLVQRYLMLARMRQHFRPNAADPGFDVVSENRFFSDGEGVEWEELTFSVNGTKWGADRPPFPLLQPEKVLSLPLDLRLTSDYRYRLAGTAEVDGVRCYVLHFDPADRKRSLYRGTVWIDAATFRQVKLQVVQTSLSAPVVSNEEIVRIGAVGHVAGRKIFLPVSVSSRQILLIAGRNLLVEKTTSFTHYEINPGDFGARRLAARRSERVMYRDTDAGVRYFVKEGDTRVVSEQLTSAAKALAMGTTIDPSFDFPLPIVGLNYLDFDFGGPGSQLALLFGGVLALGNVQQPRLGGTAFDGSLDFFAIAVPGNDRVYDVAGERESERLLTWPLSTGANIGYQFTSFQKVSARYELRFDGYVRERTTAEDFIVPRSTTTHGLGLAYEYRRGGYSVVANGTWFGRTRWEPWGDADAPTTSPRTYAKYGVSVSKTFFLSVFSRIHVNASYFGGERLDRFSQYQFGLFDDTRIHGVPSSGVRFAELAMVRGSWSFNVFDQYRFDVFLDGAGGRDADPAPWERIVGVGAAFNVRAPWNTILRVDAGKSFLPERYAEPGSTVVQILLLKPLR